MIKGISDIRRFPRAGKIRLGEMRKNAQGKEYPAAVDYFIADFDDTALNDLFHKLYGDRPKRVTIAFGSDDPEVIFSQYYRCYGSGSGLKCKGDGETAVRANEKGFEDVVCLAPDNCEFAKEHGCHPVGILQFFIKGFPTLQVAQIDTGSKNSIINVNSGIDLLRFATKGAPIVGVWCDLILKPKESVVDGRKLTNHVLDMVIAQNLDELQGALGGTSAPALPAPPPDDPEPWDAATDSDVIASIMRFSQEIQKKIITAARERGWSKVQTLDAISKQFPDAEQGDLPGAEKPPRKNTPEPDLPEPEHACAASGPLTDDFDY